MVSVRRWGVPIVIPGWWCGVMVVVDAWTCQLSTFPSSTPTLGPPHGDTRRYHPS